MSTVSLRSQRRLSLLACATLMLAVGCGTPPPAPAPAPAPVVRPPAPVAAAPAPAPRPAAPVSRFSNEADWRRAVAEQIHAAHRDRVFAGRPPHPLKAVVVVDITLRGDGQVVQTEIMRAPSHARHLGDEAAKMARAAGPYPVPPASVAARGSIRLTETWLFRDDDRFQVRTLALTQDLKAN
jgi:periplasmic protein TonB